MRRIMFLGFAACLFACGTDDNPYAPWDIINPDTDDTTPSDSWPPDSPIPDAIDTWGMDRDGDGYTPEGGDCDDTQAGINPGAYDDPENGVDDDCDGTRDNPPRDCDCVTAPTLLEGLDICDLRFVRGATELSSAPSASAEGRGVRQIYGNTGNGLDTRVGCAYSVLDTGKIEPTVGGLGDPDRQPGTDFYNPTMDPWSLVFCDGTEPDPDPEGGTGVEICDVQQYKIDFTAPPNAVGFTFDFVYLSAEYPEWVDLGFNDTFYAILDRPSTGEHINISFDDYGAEIEVDNAFFEDPPTTSLAGTGYEVWVTNEDFTNTVCGSSTGWLRTSWPIDPREEFSLTFSIHDEGDGIYDSMVILDNFRWSIDEVDPGTVII